MSEFEQWKARKFEGLTHEQLRTAGALLGCTFGPNTSDKTMRVKLCEKLGELPSNADTNESAPPPAEKPKPVKLMRVTRPRLAPGDVWEGRKHRVQVAKGPESQHHKSFVLYWNFVPKSFKYDEVIDMPEPYFNILRDAKIGTVIQHKKRDENNIWIATENEDVFTPRFSYRDLGVTPGTENLPGSILEYWQREAESKDYLRNLLTVTGGRNKLIQISADLMGSKGQGYYKDRTNEDIWQEIMQFMGFEDLFYEEVA